MTRLGLAGQWTSKFVRFRVAAALVSASAAEPDAQLPLVTAGYPMNNALRSARIGDWDRDGFGELLLASTTSTVRRAGSGSAGSWS